MSTISKLNYTNETKGLIKDSLNQFSAGITENDTFRSYVDKINDIYNNWPKIAMEGTNFQLQNTKAGKMLLTPKGNTEQETTEGYNLINLDNKTKTDRGITGTITEHSILSWKGAASTSYANITDEQNINLPIGTYTFSIDKVTSNNERVVIYLRGATSQSVVIQSGRTFVTVTTTEEKTIYWVGISNLVADNNYNGEVKLMFESGSVAHDYEPYTGGIASPNPDYPQKVKVVTGENTITVNNTDYTIDLGNIELCKIGDYSDLIFKNEKTNPYYNNTLVENAWYKKKIINLRLYNENANFQLGSASTNDYYIFQTAYKDDLADSKEGGELVCDNFVFNRTEENYQKEYVSLNANAYTYVRFHISANRLSEKSVEAFKTWLQTHNVLIYYVLENPVNIQITDATLINQLEDLNRIIIQGGTITIETESDEENAQLIINASALKRGEN